MLALFRVVAPLLAVGVVACLGAVVAYWPDPFDASPFTPAAWAAADNEGKGAMARGAIRRLWPGLPEAEALALLGEGLPIEEAWPSVSGRYGSARTHSYHLGCWNAWWHRDAHDSTFLWVHVGVDGRVIAAEIDGG